MGRAGKALRQVLEDYGISQNRVAVEIGIVRSNVYRWVNEMAPLLECSGLDARCATQD
ncbi:MAG: helix-turn-helix transcriptional regulator [Elainellaceae cyanobacterium]